MLTPPFRQYLAARVLESHYPFTIRPFSKKTGTGLLYYPLPNFIYLLFIYPPFYSLAPMSPGLVYRLGVTHPCKTYFLFGWARRLWSLFLPTGPSPTPGGAGDPWVGTARVGLLAHPAAACFSPLPPGVLKLQVKKPCCLIRVIFIFFLVVFLFFILLPIYIVNRRA